MYQLKEFLTKIIQFAKIPIKPHCSQLPNLVITIEWWLTKNREQNRYRLRELHALDTKTIYIQITS